MAFTLCCPNCALAAWVPGTAIIFTGGICRAGLWLIISFNGHLIGSSSGLLSMQSGVEVLNLLHGRVGLVYKSSEETECLCVCIDWLQLCFQSLKYLNQNQNHYCHCYQKVNCTVHLHLLLAVGVLSLSEFPDHF